MEKVNLKEDNRGFSLIELLVAMAISGVIIILVGSLMSNSTMMFNAETTKATIQNELQDIAEQLESVLMEATNLTIKEDSGVTYIFTGTWDESSSAWVEPTGVERVIIIKGKKMYVRKEVPSNIDNQDDGYMITDKLDSFSITIQDKNVWPAGMETTPTTNGYITDHVSVKVQVEMLHKKKSVSMDKIIRLRNKIDEVTDMAGTYSIITTSAAENLVAE